MHESEIDRIDARIDKLEARQESFEHLCQWVFALSAIGIVIYAVLYYTFG